MRLAGFHGGCQAVAVLCLGTGALLYGAMRFVDANVDAIRREA